MGNGSQFSIAPTAAPSSGLAHRIAAGLFATSVLYAAVTTRLLPGIQTASPAIDVFLAAVLPGLMVILLLWAARSAVYPRRRRRALIAVTLLAAAVASIIPMLLAAV